MCGPAHLFSTLDLYCQPASHVSTLNQNSMARLVEVDVLEDGLGRELVRVRVRVSFKVRVRVRVRVGFRVKAKVEVGLGSGLELG